MDNKYREMLKIPAERLDAINAVLLDPDSKVMQGFMDVVAKYGTPEEINAKAKEAGKLESLLKKVEHVRPEYLEDLQWLMEQRTRENFVTVAEYRQKVLGEAAASTKFKDEFAVTLEVSATQYFPWLRVMAEAGHRQQDARAGALHQSPQDEGAGSRRRPACDCRRDADLWRVVCGDAGHQGHGRLEPAPGRPGDHHRLLRRHRPA